MLNKNDLIVVIVSEKQSVIVRSISMRITELGINQKIVGETVSEVEKRANEADIFIVYLNDITENAIKTLVYLGDLVAEKKQFLIVIGAKDHYDDLAKAIPSVRTNIWIDRPLEMPTFNKVLEEVLAEIEKKTRKRSILIVDDDPDYASIIRGWLKDSYQVNVVTAGVQAVSFLAKKEVDLILLDYEMPVVDGPQVLQMLRQDVATAHIPVVFLTGLGTKEAVSRVMSLRPSGYLLKSTPKEDLLKFLDEKFS